MTGRRISRANAALDERLGSQKFLKKALDHIFPDNWSFMLGEIAAYCFLILVITGVWLAFFFDPSDSMVVYHGPYAPLHEQTMNLAYQSTVNLSLEVRAGLLIRQIHHWTADLFVTAIVCHLARIFFTGAFRKPRELNWVVGVTLLLLAIFNGFTGYSLPGDLMSGLGLRIAYSIALSIPWAGNWLAYLFFGGQFPSSELTHRIFILHVFVAPLLIFGLLGIHLALIWRQKHTQFPGEGRSERKLVGSHLYPTYAFRSIALLLIVAGVVSLLGGLVQINPIWEYGPYHPYLASSFAQPDWYTGWLEGSLRLMPPWRLHLFGWTVSEVFWPAVVLPLGTFLLLWIYPFVERWWTGDHLYHNLLDRPRDRPGRTALGVAGLTFYFVLTVAGAQDVLGFYLDIQQPPVTFALRGLLIGLPLLAGAVTWKICRDLAGTPGVKVSPPVESADKVMPPPTRYLPDRVAWQDPETGIPAAGSSAWARKAATVGTAVTLGALAASWARRGRRAG
ncbi:MAG TPA: cytochrome bc complex cytochrome b subunit [Acidimicrobiales bacterium]|nr:cytochrome bc complex cytochrome b subunit [Acidimicrobiales bacterium]